MALTNQLLLRQLEQLLESLVNLINIGIDEKSPYTGRHCQFVPELTMMLADAVHATTHGPMADFQLSENERKQLWLAGLLGKRNKEKFSLKTPVATIGIRGTYFMAEYIGAGGSAAPGLAPPKTVLPQGPALAPGLYTSVTSGQIVVSNPAGVLEFAAGQFGFTPGFKQPPVMLPTNPGMQFTLPFTLGSGNIPTASNSTPGKPDGIDCIVR